MTLFPELRWDGPNNTCESFRALGEFGRRGSVRVVGHEIDATGKLVLRIELPGSKTVVNREHRR